MHIARICWCSRDQQGQSWQHLGLWHITGATCRPNYFLDHIKCCQCRRAMRSLCLSLSLSVPTSPPHTEPQPGSASTYFLRPQAGRTLGEARVSQGGRCPGSFLHVFTVCSMLSRAVKILPYLESPLACSRHLHIKQSCKKVEGCLSHSTDGKLNPERHRDKFKDTRRV